MKTNLTHVAYLMTGLTIAALAADERGGPAARPTGFQKQSLLIPAGHPFPLISSAGWTNGYYTTPFELKKGLSMVSPSSQTKTAAVAKLAGVSVGGPASTGYFRVYKGPRWLTNAMAVSNAVQQAPLAGPGRPLPPTGLRVIAVGR